MTALTTSQALPVPLSEPEPADSLRRGVAWLALSTVTVGLLNYGYSLSLTWLLPVAGYSVYATGQALLLLGGTVSSVSTPWVLSRELSRAPQDAAVRRAAVSFAVLVGLAQGLLAAAAAAAVASRFSSPTVTATIALTMLATFCAANVVGYLQGFQRFRAIVGMRLVEVLGKLVSGLALVAVGVGAAGALGGFGIGSLAVVAVGVIVMRHDLRLRLDCLRHSELWRQAIGLGAIQGAVALLASLDVVLAGALGDAGPGLASFQVSTILARIPLFLSVAVSTVAFPKLTAGRGSPSPVIASSTEVFLRTVVPVSLLVATIPGALIGVAFPAQYATVETLLPYTAATGALVGVLNLIATFFQAQRRFARCIALVAAGLPVQAGAILVGLRAGGIAGLAVGALVGAGLVTVGLVLDAERIWPGAMRLRWKVVAGWLVALPLPLLKAYPLLWLGWAAVVAAAVAWTCLRPASKGRAAAVTAMPQGGRRLRILHLAFEDHRRPGSGGGAIRTREINRLLAQRHDVTVVTSRYPGCRERVEDGVRYVQVGLAAGYFGSMLTYFLALPLALRRYPSDLVVEDFAAPFSSVLVPWWTRRPVVGVVQWLFARQKSRQYKLPFFVVEALGVRSHRRMVAVSSDLASQLRGRNGRARVDVVHNGVAPELFATRAHKGTDLVFLGRVEIAQKGLDMLLEAFASVAGQTDARLVVAGDGPDVAAVRERIRSLGLDGRVELVGRVEGEAKRALLASAQLVCMPSRYETFGMVAAEAMACGTPVLAFDIPCLREVLPTECGVLVPAFDVGAFATALAELAGDADRCAAMGQAGRDAARRFDWQRLARRQERVYLDAVRERAGGPPPAVPASSAVLGSALAGLCRAHRGRVLLFGNYGNGNLGDEAILARLVQVAGGHCDLTVVARNPERVRELHGVEAVRTTSAKALLTYLRSDVLAIGGGGIFGYGMPTLPRLLPAVAILGRLLGKRTAYLAIGAYDGMPPLVRVLLRLSARLSGLVSVRDAESYRTLDVGWPWRRSKPLLVTDPGFELTPVCAADAADLLAGSGVRVAPPPLGISLKPTPSPELNELAVRAVAGAIDWWCENRGGDVVFFALSHRGDYGLGEAVSDLTLAGRLAERLRHPERLHVVGPNLHPAALKGAIGLTCGVVALRLHAQIFAWAMRRPLLGLSFERKSDAFLGEAGAARLGLAGLTTDDIVCWLEGLEG